MSSTKFFQVSAIFIAAFLFGISWVGIFYLFQYGTREAVFLTGQTESKKKTEVLPMSDEFFTPPQVDENNPKAFDPEGIYTVTGTISPVFDNFESIVISNKELSVDCDHVDFGKLLKPSGFIYFRTPKAPDEAGSVADFRDLTIGNGLLKFQAISENGVTYSFEGEFLIKGNFYTLDPDAEVLKGTLTKMVDGKTVAETEISFTWSIDLSCVC